MRTRTIGVLSVLILGGALLVPGTIFAATLNVVPATTRVMAGDIVTVRVVLRSTDQSVNAAGGTLSFPIDFLKVLSLDTSSSIFSLWIQQPSFSNTQGTVTFNGGVPSPGFTGAAGTIMTVAFQAKKAGTATLAFSNVSVFANDGLGTNVLQSTGSATLTIQNLPDPVSSPVPVAKPAVEAKKAVSNTIAASTTPVVATTTPEAVPVSLSAGEATAIPLIPLQGNSLSNLIPYVIAIVLAIMLTQLGVMLFIAHRLRLFQRGLESGISKSEKDLHNGFALLKDDFEQHLKQLESTRSPHTRVTEEEKLKTEIEGDIADLELFTRKNFEDLRSGE